MGTFVEFYTTLLGFVNYRLYTSIGLVYPPRFNAKSDEQGGELAAFQLEGKANATNGTAQRPTQDADINPEAQAIADRIAAMPPIEEEEEAPAVPLTAIEYNDEEPTEGIDKFEPTAPDADILPQPQASSAEVASLFAHCTFYLSRETPRASLEFILKAFGCKRVGWDGVLGDGAFTTNESDPSITHQIIDRPPLSNVATVLDNAPSENGAAAAAAPKAQWPHSTAPGRTYVQPQWVWDCINQGKLLRPDLYAPGAELPPHLSPWVKPKKGEYDPNLPLEAQQPEGEAEAFDDASNDDDDAFDEDQDEDMDAIVDRDGSSEVGEGMDIAELDSDDDSDASESDHSTSEQEFEGFDSDAESDISEREAARLQHQRELEAEATGAKLQVARPSKKEQNAAIRKKFEKKKREEEEERERQKMMLSNKKRKLLKRIEYGENKRDGESENLRRKRARLEKAKLAAEAL